MFDGTHPGADRVLDADSAVGVGGDELALGFGGLDHCAHLRFGEFRFAGFGADSEHCSCCNRLDKVGTVFDQVAGLCSRLFGRAANAQPHVGGQLLVRHHAVQFAATLRDGDIGPSHKHARAGDMTRVDCVA